MSMRAASARSARSELRAWAAQLRALGELGKLAVPAIGIALGQELRRTISAGEAPDGKPWRLTQGGDVPLTDAMSAVKIHTRDTRVTVVVSGPEAWHNSGFARGGIRRRVIPGERRLPPAYAQAMSRAISETFKRILSGDLK